jgi:hypothetical protein
MSRVQLVPGRPLAEITRNLPPFPVELDHEKTTSHDLRPGVVYLVTLPVKEFRGCPSCPCWRAPSTRRARHGDRPGHARGQPRTLAVITGVTWNRRGQHQAGRPTGTGCDQGTGWNPRAPGPWPLLVLPGLSPTPRDDDAGHAGPGHERGALAAEASRATAARGHAMIGFSRAGGG